MNLETRNQLRKSKIIAREQLTQEDRACFSRMISEQILASNIYRAAHTIMIYKSIKGEVCLEEIERAALFQEKILYYPLCVSKSEMIALSPQTQTAWKPGAFGILEPMPEYSVQIEPSEIDLILCPCTVFDESCGRMGMGGGYYDRFLEKCTKAYVAAVAFEVQKAAQVPMESWDRRMDMIFTEKKVYINRKSIKG